MVHYDDVIGDQLQPRPDHSTLLGSGYCSIIQRTEAYRSREWDVAMDFDFVEWDSEDDPRGNTDHIADNGLSVDEVEDVLYDSLSRPVQSRSSSRPALIGQTSTGKTIIVIYERHDDGGIVVVRPVSAYEIED
jgi:uncharacterized DUF497 family protein